MSNATLDGIEFRINPSAFQWEYRIKTSATPTIGGKVIQILGTTFSDLVLTGKMGSEDAHIAFFKQVLKIADEQVPSRVNPAPLPVRFVWPERNFDFLVYVKGMTQSGAETAVKLAVDTVAPEYQLVLFVAEDNGNVIKQAANTIEADFLTRLTKGMGWAQSSWNGPLTDHELTTTLAGASVVGYLEAGLNGLVTTGTRPSTAATGQTTGR